MPIAWGVARTDMPGKGFVRVMIFGAFITPPYLGAIGWILLAGPNAGWLNKAWMWATGSATGLINVYSFGGLVLVTSLYAFPYIFVFTADALERVSSEMEEAANILGAGGIQDNPEIRGYYERHKKVTGVDGDSWGSPMYYTLLQIIEQAAEGVGEMDRAKITDYLKSHTFKTIIGEVDIRNQKLDKYWTVGQWQDGFFHAVAGVGFSDYKPVNLKTGW